MFIQHAGIVYKDENSPRIPIYPDLGIFYCGFEVGYSL